ncbi:uncharacterized protein [Oscarella lobularis]|uniref:uncharacterized protein isoform X2 n=1 Tax=Oscarella lobularis TaxID=121494 RepID=UPI0033131A24
MEEDEFFSAIGKGDREVISHFIQSYPERWKEAANELGETSLHFALDAETAEFLISAGASLEAVDEFGFTPFLRAVRSRHTGVVAVLIEHGCNLSAKNNDGNGALGIASVIGHLESVKQFVGLGFSVNGHYEDGFTPLHLACHHGHAETAEFLISAGARLEALDVWGCTPFLRAVCKGHSVVTANLIDCGCNIFAKDDGTGALAFASQCGHLDSVKQLVGLGVSVNEHDMAGYTALHLACCKGHSEIAKFLISSGASLETLDNWGHTPFLLAIRNGNSEVMAALIDCGCNIFAKDNNGTGALAFASQYGLLDSAKQLVGFGISVNERDLSGYTSLHLASAEGHTKVVKFLISAGASLERVERLGYTPFLFAIRGGQSEVIAALIERGCNVSAKSYDGNGALALASQQGFLNIAKQLVEMGLRVNEPHQDGLTSLHWACREGRAETAKYLISVGADIEATNKFDKTPLFEAEVNKHYFLVDYLLNFISEAPTEGGYISEIYDEDTQYRLISVESSDEEVSSYHESEDRFQEIYDEALKRGSVTVNRSRLIVVGQDRAGKSCLVDSLLNRPFESEKASTEGAAVAMTHTAASGWVATDSKDHLDPLIAQGVYRMNQQQSASKSSHDNSPEFSHVDKSSEDFDSKIAESEVRASAAEVHSASSLEALGNDLKAMGIEAKTLTPNQQELVSTFLENKPSEEDLNRQSLGVRDIWDLGGQEVYLATHSALMPDTKTFCLTMYMVVMDISKSLSDKAESFHRSSDGDVVDQTNELGWIRTNGDFPFYWFGSITAAHEETKRGDHWLGEDEEVVSPPVFAIGTHRDVLDSDEERFPDSAAVNKWLLNQGELIEQLLKGSEFVKHIVLPKKHGDKTDDKNFCEMTHFVKRIFLIDNSVSGSASPCKTVNEIRQRVDRMTSTYWRRQQKQPLFWVYLEILLFRWKEAMKAVVAKVDDVVKLAQHRSICNISSRDEVLVALKYLANVGAILYYPEVDDLSDVVFTSPTWVVKALSAFVTAAKPGPIMEPKWDTLKEKGVMSRDLMDYRLKQMREASDFGTATKGTDLDLKEENRLIVRLLQLLDVITPVVAAGSTGIEFYVPSMLRPLFLYPLTYWERHSRSPPFPAPLIVIPMKLKFVPECLYFRLVTRFLKLYPKNPELSRHQCVFLVEDIDSTAEVEVELLYHSRGNWVALTVHYVNKDDVAQASASFLHSIREELCRQMRKICYQGMGGFDYSVCCQLEEAVRRGKHLDIDLKNLPVLSTRKKFEYYSPRNAKLYNKFGKRLPVDPADFLRIHCWFNLHHPMDAKLGSSLGTLPDAIDGSLIRVVATLAEAKWQRLAFCLGRKGHAIPQYKEKSSEDFIRASMVIEDWCAERGPTAATVYNLIRACEKCGIHRDRIASAYKEEL